MTDEITQHLPRLRRYARALVHNRDDADDLVQDTVERAWSRLRLFQAGSRCDHWLLSIMHNLYVNDIRRRATRPAQTFFDVELSPADTRSPSARLEIRDLDRALRQLPDEQRAALLLVTVEECSYSDAATILGVPIGTVMSRLSRARDRLRQLMAAPGAQVNAAPVLRVVR